MWSIVWTWIDDFVKQKIYICGYYDFKENLLKYINPESLEERFGGNKPDIQENYFPPRFLMAANI